MYLSERACKVKLDPGFICAGDEESCGSMLLDVSEMTKVCFHHCCNGVGLRMGRIVGFMRYWKNFKKQ